MSKHFRPWNIDQTLLLPPNVRDFVPKDHSGQPDIARTDLPVSGPKDDLRRSTLAMNPAVAYIYIRENPDETDTHYC
jgi:hypothetical protein